MATLEFGFLLMHVKANIKRSKRQANLASPKGLSRRPGDGVMETPRLTVVDRA